MYHHIIKIIIAGFIIIVPMYAKDIPASKDHPMIKRYKDSEIKGYDVQKYGELTLPLGKAVLKESVAYDKEKRVEGTLTRLLYLVPAERSTLEIYKNYEEELKKADFTILYECRGDDECGKLFHQAIWSQERALHNTKDLEMVFNSPEDQRVMVAKQTSDRGDVYALLYIARNASSVPEWASKRVTVLLEVLETAKMDNNMVKVDADKMSKEIDVSGHIALYGIYFDVDKSDIKPESAPLLSEIAKLLKHNPSLSLYVVGHTDNTGTFEHNQNLSRKRAESVVKFLIQNEHIDAKRLKGYGVGPLAPIATNDTEEGKAKNRRVELIKQ
jgi:OmpA-OmpF porin, OOP family